MFVGQELETSFKKGDSTSELLIAGLMYTIDFQNMVQVVFLFLTFCFESPEINEILFQYRRNDPNRRRRIKRDQMSNITNWKGVAGLRLPTTAGNRWSKLNLLRSLN